VIVGHVCNPFVVTIASGSSVHDAALLMREHHVGDLIVVDDDGDGPRPLGIITDRDIVIGLVAKEVTDLSGLLVDEVITRDLVTISETDTVGDAAVVMRENGIRRLPVVDAQGTLQGILTLDDLLAVLVETLGELVDVVQSQRSRERELRP
jgi:CBS domain-containing protein